MYPASAIPLVLWVSWPKAWATVPAKYESNVLKASLAVTMMKLDESSVNCLVLSLLPKSTTPCVPNR